MTDVDDIATGDDSAPTDGRVARRQRNIDAVLSVVIEMFTEESLFPTMEQAATRSGLSLRSLYRYFEDPADLLEAAIKRSRERGRSFARLHRIGQGPLDERIEAFVSMRLDLWDKVGPMYRATMANADRHPRIREERAKTRDELSEQFAAQFAPELEALHGDDGAAAHTAGDLLTQFDSLDFMLRHRELSVEETEATLRTALLALLG